MTPRGERSGPERQGDAAPSGPPRSETALGERLERLARRFDERDRVLARLSRTRGVLGVFGLSTATS